MHTHKLNASLWLSSASEMDAALIAAIDKEMKRAARSKRRGAFAEPVQFGDNELKPRRSPSGDLVGIECGAQYIQLWTSEPITTGIEHSAACDLSASISDLMPSFAGLEFRAPKVDPFIERLRRSLTDPTEQQLLREEYGYYAPMVSPSTGMVIGVQLGTTNYPFPAENPFDV